MPHVRTPVGPPPSKVRKLQQALDGLLFFTFLLQCLYFFIFDVSFNIAANVVYIVIFAILFILCLVRAFCLPKGPPEVKCPLCGERINPEPEEQLAHRLSCQSTNCSLLDSHPVLYPDARCPTCMAPLRLWAKDFTETFDCKGCWETHMNRGNNLLKCFPCDHNLCLDCVQHQLGIMRERKQRARRQQQERARMNLMQAAQAQAVAEAQAQVQQAADHFQTGSLERGRHKDSSDTTPAPESPPPTYHEALQIV